MLSVTDGGAGGGGEAAELVNGDAVVAVDVQPLKHLPQRLFRQVHGWEDNRHRRGESGGKGREGRKGGDEGGSRSFEEK